MKQFLDDMAFILANVKVAAGLLLVSAVSFALYAFDVDASFRGAPLDLVGWATGVLGVIVLVAAGIRRARRKG